MKLTPRLWIYKIHRAKLIRKMWESRGKYRNHPLKIPEHLQKLGVTVHDPLEEFAPKAVEWKPPVNDPRFEEEPSITDHPLYHEHPALSYNSKAKFILGMDQVCALTKTLQLDGLPDNVTSLINKVNVPNKEKLLRHYIYHSQEWITTRDTTPRRNDPDFPKRTAPREYAVPIDKAIEVLITNMIRLCRSTATQFPSTITNQRLISSPQISTNFSYRGEQILIEGKPLYLLGSDQDLPPFVVEDAIDQSAQMDVPNTYPINPTIDLIKEHIFDDVIYTGFKSPYTYSKPHTLFVANTELSAEMGYPTDMYHLWTDSDGQCRALMYCFAVAMNRAKEKYGEGVINLPEPVSVQCVNLNQTTLNFMCFQLNTLNLDSDNGIKNFVWTDTGNKMFNILLPRPSMKDQPELLKRRFIDFDPTPFDKLCAMIVYGLPEVPTSV